MAGIPKLKKKVSSFLTKEDGKISKENLIKAGVLLSAVAIASLKATEAGHSDSHRNTHTNNLGLTKIDEGAEGTHSHAAHNNHSNHSSHGSHCNCSTMR